MKKHIFSLLACLSFMLLLLPMTAFAAGPEIIIGGETVDTSADWYATTDEDGIVTVCDSADDWNIQVTMDDATAVVTLNNATINNNIESAIKTTDCDLHIILEGTQNQIGTNSTDTGSYAIDLNSGNNMNIDGDGDLTIKGNYGIEVNGSGNVAIAIAGDLEITSYWQSVSSSADFSASAESIVINGYGIISGSVSLSATDGDVSVSSTGSNAISGSSNVMVDAAHGEISLSGGSYAVYNDGNPVNISAKNSIELTGSVYGSIVYVGSLSGDVTINGHYEAIGYVGSSGVAAIYAPEGDVTVTSGNTSNIISGSYGFVINITTGGTLNAQGGYGFSSYSGAVIKADAISVEITNDGYGFIGGQLEISNPDDNNCSLVSITRAGGDARDAISASNLSIKSDLVKIIAADDAEHAIKATGTATIVDTGVIVGDISVGTDAISDGVIRAAANGSDASEGLNLADGTPAVSTYYKAGDGYVVWEPLDSTLTLHNASISNTELAGDALSECGIALPSGDITIAVEGTNEITSINAYGIGSEDASVNLVGNGTLNADSAHAFGIGLLKNVSGDTLNFVSDPNVIINGIVYVNNGDANKSFTVYGDVTVNSGSSWEGSVTIAEDAALTISEGDALWLNKADLITNNGQIINNGTIILPYDYSVEEIQNLHITGDGEIQLFDEVSSKFRIFIDGTIYAYGGDSNVDLTTAPTEVTYFKAEDGYIIYTPDDATLTLHNVNSSPDITLPDSPITLLLEGENEVDYIYAYAPVTVDGNGTLDANYIDCTAEGAELNENSGATLNAVCETEADGVTTYNVYGLYLSDGSYNLGGNYKMALMPGSVFTLTDGSGIEFCEGSTLNDITFGVGSKIINNSYMILPMGTTSEDIAALPLSGSGVVYVATTYNGAGDPEEKSNPYTNDGVELANVIDGDLSLGNTEVAADEDLGYTWLKTGEGENEVWTLTLDNTFIGGSLNLPDETIVINTTGYSTINRSINLGMFYPCDITFTGSGKLNVIGNISGGEGGEATISQGADVTLLNGLNVGFSGGVNGALTVNGTLTASALYGATINTGSLKIGSKGVLNVSGQVGIKLNGMMAGEFIVYDDAFVIEDGGTLNADCTDANIEVFTGFEEITEDTASDDIVLPEGYMPSNYLIRIVSGENGGTQYASTIATESAILTLEAELVDGAGGELTLKHTDNNNNNNHNNSGGGGVVYVLTFDTNGGSSIPKLYKAYGTVIKLDDYVTTYDGYDFDGWYSDKELTKNITSVKLTANTTVYAKWTEKGSSTTNTTAAVNPFTDISKDSYYYDAVLWAVDNGITSGTTDTLYSPELICTRAQMAALLWRAMGSVEPITVNCPFTDIYKDDYYYKAVLWAVDKNITAGTTPTTFSPNQTITRAEALSFLWRAAGRPVCNCINPFTDIAQGDYYYDAVMWAVERGITSGTSSTTFSPSQPCTRGQIMTFMYNSNVSSF